MQNFQDKQVDKNVLLGEGIESYYFGFDFLLYSEILEDILQFRYYLQSFSYYVFIIIIDCFFLNYELKEIFFLLEFGNNDKSNQCFE